MSFLSKFVESIISGLTGKVPITKPDPICPLCQKKMDKNTIDFCQVFLCSSCEGVWLSQDVLIEMLREPELAIPQLEASTPATEHTFQRSEQWRVCPNCDTHMDNYQFDYSSGIWIDACPHNHGIWLDSGELRLIREFRVKMSGALTPEEKQKMAVALIDGATQSRQNINEQIRKDMAAQHRRQSLG